MKKNLSNHLKGFILALAGAILFSSKAIFVKLAYASTPIDAISLLTLRMFFAFPFYAIMAVCLVRKTSNQKLTAEQWLRVAFLGIMGYYASSILDFLGLQYISAGLERLILFLYPTIVVLINVFLYKERPSQVQLIALVTAYTGVVIAFWGNRQTATHENFLLGSVLVFLCAITFAIYTVGSSKMVRKIGSLKFTTFAMLFATFGVMLHFIAQHQQLPVHYPKSIYWISFSMAIAATVIPTYLISEGIRIIGANNTGIISNIGPVSTIIQAYLFLGERISWQEVIGTALVMCGVLLIGYRNNNNNE